MTDSAAIAQALGGRRCGAGWMAHCPAHDDGTPSLSVTTGDDGKVLVCCRAGCEQQDVISALRSLGLWAAAGNDAREHARRTRHEIRDETGRLAAVHVREDRPGRRKRLWWELPDGAQGLRGRPTTTLPLYGCEGLASVERSATVILTEGERAADSLAALGVIALGTVTGAAATPSDDVLRVLVGRDVVLWPDHDEPGRRHMRLIATRLRALGVKPRWLAWPGARERGDDAADFRKRAGTRDDLEALVAAALPVTDGATTADASPWSRAMSVSALLAEPDGDVEWIARDIAAPGSITGVASPRGLGKTHVVHALAVAVANGGVYRGERLRRGRVLLIDRDNSRREIRRRLRAWGADACGNWLRVLTRDEAPALTDAEAWSTFPFADYELVILDSWGASTEGVEDRDAGRTSVALASLLELARRGPAVVVLLNVPKDARSYRGSGVIADRLDVLYEVRDITDLQPSPKAASWWSTLAEAGEAAWQERATRRRKRDDYRLALVASKFRIGEEPDPIALEIQLGDEWALEDVTAELEAAHEHARGETAERIAETRKQACEAVAKLVAERHATGKPLTICEADGHVQRLGLTRREARDVVRESPGELWRVVPASGRGRGRRVLVPVSADAAAKIEHAGDRCGARTFEESVLAACAAQPRRKSGLCEPLGEMERNEPRFSPPSVEEQPTEAFDV